MHGAAGVVACTDHFVQCNIGFHLGQGFHVFPANLSHQDFPELVGVPVLDVCQ